MRTDPHDSCTLFHWASLALIPLVCLFALSCETNKEIAVNKPENANRAQSIRPTGGSVGTPAVQTSTAATPEVLMQTRWSSNIKALKGTLDDQAFRRQWPVLTSFYEDVMSLGEQHHSSSLQGASTSEQDTRAVSHLIAYTSLETVLDVIKALPRTSRDHTLYDISQFFKSPSLMDECRPVLSAYINASEEVQAQYKVDPRRAADISDREQNLRRVVSEYVRDDDYLSALVVGVHVRMLVQDIQWSLRPFELQVFRKSRPMQ
jgi:hypothetical protein